MRPMAHSQNRANLWMEQIEGEDGPNVCDWDVSRPVKMTERQFTYQHLPNHISPCQPNNHSNTDPTNIEPKLPCIAGMWSMWREYSVQRERMGKRGTGKSHQDEESSFSTQVCSSWVRDLDGLASGSVDNGELG